MSLLLKIMGVAICAAILDPLIKKNNPELSAALVIAASIVILYMLSDTASQVIKSLKSLYDEVSGMEEYMSVILKVTGIAWVCEYGSSLLSDCGEAALGKKIELSGKLIILTLAIPVIKILYKSVIGLI